MVQLAMFVSILGVGGLALCLANGAAAPPQAPILRWQDTTLDWANGTDRQRIQPNQIKQFQAPKQLPNDAFSLIVDGILWADSPTLSAWGIWLQTSTSQQLLVGLNGHQYVTARYCPLSLVGIAPEDCTPATEPEQGIATVWKPFHLIAPINHNNRLALHYLPAQHANRLTIRFDGEKMWDIEFELPQIPVIWGLWFIVTGSDQSFVQWTSAAIWGTIGQN